MILFVVLKVLCSQIVANLLQTTVEATVLLNTREHLKSTKHAIVMGELLFFLSFLIFPSYTSICMFKGISFTWVFFLPISTLY